MSLATSNRDGGRTNEAGHLRGVTKGFLGQVLSGLNVSQRGAGANMSVDVAIGDAIIQRSDGTYGHPAWNDAVYNQAIAAADGSNPRRDIVVMYIDYGQTPSTGVANNTNGVVKITSVSGTAAGSPVDPSNATIQSAVGSGNPFIKLARVRVAAGATSISNSVIDDLRQLAVGMVQGGWVYDSVYTWVYASATTFTIAGVDVRSQFPVGTKIRLYQSGTLKYFTVTAASFSTNTTITLDGGNGTYTLTNVPIDAPQYSYEFTPQGYPRQTLFDPYNGYEEIGRTTLSSAGGSLEVSNLPYRKYLRILIYTIPTGGTADSTFRLNNDTGNNYSYRNSTDGGADSSVTSTSFWGGSASTSEPRFIVYDIVNIPNREKLGYVTYVLQGTAGAGNATSRREQSAKWSNTSAAISRAGLQNSGSGNYAIGSEIVVLGKN